MDIEGFNLPAIVTVVDYSAKRCSTSKKMRMLEDFQEFFHHDRPKWARVRWINVDGLNWQCIKLLATKYNLHRLAVEDLLSVQRTKMDLYPNRIFLYYLLCLTIDTYVCVLLHVLIGDDDQIVVTDEDNESEQGSTADWIERRSPQPSRLGQIKSFFSKKAKQHDLLRDAETAAGIDETHNLPVTPIAQHYYPDRNLIYNQVKSTRQSNLTVAVEQVSIFLTNDGTVITFFQVYR
jgi:Mg2+ and Co2+ transporter CorA